MICKSIDAVPQEGLDRQLAVRVGDGPVIPLQLLGGLADLRIMLGEDGM